ncbi:MAG: vitamin B12 transporter [Brevundimonas sp.]|jgi:vitamin B12 transporter|uniref:TonB-dependent receptor plug domain-containing protein n=1 Tax=Brevundimonas sp. TaxID=1871086 RepID=UPI0039E406AA
MRRSLILCSAASAALFALPALADDATDVDEVVITATRVPAIVAETPGARVIDEDAIAQRGAVFAADILADVPGLSVTRSGAFSGPATVRIRGAHPGKTLVLVDGAVVNDAADIDGAFDFTGFDLGDVERIEVLSGPQSSLWGSSAIGGVIAFTTRELDGIRAEAEAGSFDTIRGRLAGGVANDRYAVGAFVSHFDTDGISAADEADGNTEADGATITTIGANGRYSFSPAVTLEGRVRYNETEADIDGFPAPSYALSDTDDSIAREQMSGFGRLTVQALGLEHQVSVSASDLTRESFSDFPSTFEADRQVYRWQASGESAEDRVKYAFGAEHEDATGALSSGVTEELSTTSIFATARFDLSERFSLTGGLRQDDTDDFGDATTGRLSAAYELGGGFILSGAWGTGFKAPTVSQAVCDFCFSAEPYPELRPEHADGYEAALGWRSADRRLEGRVTVYRLEVEDQIVYFTDPVFNSYYVNIDETRTDGVEVEGRADLPAGFDLSLAYAWTDAVDATDGSRLLRVPEHAASATLGWTGERLSGALTLRSESDMLDSGGERAGFVTANLNAVWALTEQVSLTARVENLADEHYQQLLGYGEPGRSGYVGIRLRY